jgi:hypothetical protein
VRAQPTHTRAVWDLVEPVFCGHRANGHGLE